MAQSPRGIPATFPQALGVRMLKADTQRQISMLRQEFVTELLGVLGEAREPSVRQRLVRLAEHSLKAAIATAGKAESLWPALEEAKEIIDGASASKPAAGKKHLKLFEQYDRVHQRSLPLLKNSFDNIRVILDRLCPPEQSIPKPGQAIAAKK